MYNTRQYLVSSCCKKTYDFTCSNVSFESFKIMTKERKDEWKCNLCWEEFHAINFYYTCGPSTSTENTDLTPNNNNKSSKNFNSSGIYN